MFCENCGKKINVGNSFCSYCGKPLNINSDTLINETQQAPINISLFNSNDKKVPPEKRWWYRFFQVVYFVIFMITVIAILAGAYGNIPKQVIDDEKTVVNCSNGKSYNLSKSYIYLAQEPDLFADTEISSLCTYGNTYSGNTNTNNYILDLSYKTQGNWNSVVNIGLFGLAIAIFALYLIRCTFKYIFFGTKFFS